MSLVYVVGVCRWCMSVVYVVALHFRFNMAYLLRLRCVCLYANKHRHGRGQISGKVLDEMNTIKHHLVFFLPPECATGYAVDRSTS